MKDPLFNIGYGLYVISSQLNGKDNACITNSVMQLSDNPKTIAISLNKLNYTHDMIIESKLFNISILTEEVPFDVIKHFGFQSGRNLNKFENCQNEYRSENGIIYIPKYTNSFISGKVTTIIDCNTHSLFISNITESKILSDKESATYDYYHKNIKPQANNNIKKGWKCKVCGYVYEDENLPEDFICPWCKHGVSDFERISL